VLGVFELAAELEDEEDFNTRRYVALDDGVTCVCGILLAELRFSQMDTKSACFSS
jgi:hypothetical protein